MGADGSEDGLVMVPIRKRKLTAAAPHMRQGGFGGTGVPGFHMAPTLDERRLANKDRLWEDSPPTPPSRTQRREERRKSKAAAKSQPWFAGQRDKLKESMKISRHIC